MSLGGILKDFTARRDIMEITGSDSLRHKLYLQVKSLLLSPVNRHFPIQNFEKIFPSTSSVAISDPVISPK
jgi:hypothetical protein